MDEPKRAVILEEVARLAGWICYATDHRRGLRTPYAKGGGDP